MLHQRWPKNQQTRVRIILEFGNPNRILAEEFFDQVEREIAALDVNQLRRRSSPIDESHQIGVRSDHRMTILSCPIPDFLITCLLEANIAWSRSRLKRDWPGRAEACDISYKCLCGTQGLDDSRTKGHAPACTSRTASALRW
jgi:hypothetical protein